MEIMFKGAQNAWFRRPFKSSKSANRNYDINLIKKTKSINQNF